MRSSVTKGTVMAEHEAASHYWLILEGAQARAMMGLEDHIVLIETALCADLDRCGPCFDSMVEQLGDDPVALVAVRRFGTLMLGTGSAVAMHGTPEEAADIQLVIEHLDQAQQLAVELLHCCTEFIRSARRHHDELETVRRRPGKRKPVRHPSRRVRRRDDR